MRGAVDLLARLMAEAFHEMRTRLHGLTDEGFFREPASGVCLYRISRNEPDPTAG